MYDPFSFKDNMELVDSFESEFLHMGGFLRKDVDFELASKKRVDVGQQVCIV